jgi:SET domain-containing protein
VVNQHLYIKKITTKGRGVFTKKKIDAHTVIESSPVIVMAAADRLFLDRTLLHDYIFEWGVQKDQCCMALGLVPLYNHSYQSNCEYFMDFEQEIITVKTVRAVHREEELTINYNGNWDDSKKIWFDAK